MKSIGLGDSVEKFTKATGIKKMVKFIKVPTLAAGVAGETLIPIDQIGGMAAVSTGAGAGAITTLTVSMTTGKTAGITSGIYVVVLSAPIVAPATTATRVADMIASFNAALTANPGGVVSTVVPPLTTAQNPLAQTGSGRQPIINPAVRNRFRSAIFTA